MKKTSMFIILRTACITALVLAVTSINSIAGTSVRTLIDTTHSTPINNYVRQQNLSPEPRQSLYIWQGFEHEWQRFVVLRNSGRVPHRISKLHNYIQQPQPQQSQIPPSQEEPKQAHFHFAQSTGVDGNYMNPKGNYSFIKSSGMRALSGDILLQWTDETTESDAPVANNKIRDVISIPLAALDRESDELTMILQGIALDLSCDNDLQPDNTPCNSNGMWPYVFHIAIEQCAVEQQQYNCDLNIDIYRAWTPNKGGFQLPPVFEEIKPLNRRLDYALRVHFSLISGQAGSFTHQPNNEVSITSNIHQRQNQTTLLTSNLPTKQITQSVHAITSFGFALTPPEHLEQHWDALGSDTSQQGRYIGKITNNITNKESPNGLPQTIISQSLWAPVTVVNATGHVYLGTRALFFDEQSTVVKTKNIKGKLCINSTSQAPAFSMWRMCDHQSWLARLIYGGKQQSTQAVALPPLHHSLHQP